MKYDSYFYNCSEPYLQSISPTLFHELIETVEILPKRGTQAEINNIFFDLNIEGLGLPFSSQWPKTFGSAGSEC